MSTETIYEKPADQLEHRWWLFTACVLISLTNELSAAVTNLSLGPMRSDLGTSSAVMQMAVTLGKLMLSRQEITAATEALRQSIQKGAESGGLAIAEMVRTQLADAYRYAFSLGAGAVFACSALICLLCAVYVWFGLKKMGPTVSSSP